MRARTNVVRKMLDHLDQIRHSLVIGLIPLLNTVLCVTKQYKYGYCTMSIYREYKCARGRHKDTRAVSDTLMANPIPWL